MEAALKGLNGGHSGDDINKKRANAIKLLARFLFLENEKLGGELRLVSFNSGKMHNAIPRDGKIVFAVKNEAKEQVRADWNIFASEVEDEFHVTEQSMQFNMGSADAAPVIEKTVADKFIMALQAVDNGPLTNCQDEALAEMVETSSNVASVATDGNSIHIVASQRSNVMSNLDNMTNTVKASIPPGWSRGKRWRKIPSMEDACQQQADRHHREELRKALRQEAIGKGHPCRSGVRSLL